MLTKAQIKHIRSLADHKNRLLHQQFVVEGVKLAGEWLTAGVPLDMVICVKEWRQEHAGLLSKNKNVTVFEVEEHVLEQLSGLSTPNKVLLVARTPEPAPLPAEGWVIALDNIQDPGNLGTIIRIADWFRIPHVVCSAGTADAWNPKVVQAAMGGHLRVNLHYTVLETFLHNVQMPVFAAMLHGTSVFDEPAHKEGVIVIGNESKGISTDIAALATNIIKIPGKGGAESLNAAVSAGIICAVLIEGK